MKKLFVAAIILTLLVLVGNVQATSVIFSSITYDDTVADVGTTRTISITMRSSGSGESVNINSISLSGGLTEVSTPATPFTVTYSGVSKDYVVRSDTAGTYTFAVNVVDTGGTSYTSSSNTLEYVDPASFTLTVSEYPSGTYSANSQFGVVASVYNSLSSAKTRNMTLWFDTTGFTVSGDLQSALVTLPATTATQKIWNVTVGNSVTAGTRHAYIRLGDNTQAASYSFTVPSTATTTTASTGTGGSLGSTTGATVKITKTYTSVTPDLPKTITATDLVDTGTMLTEIFFDVKERVTFVDISVEKLAEKPADVAAVPATVYKYINISKNNLEDNNLESAYIKFKIEKSWTTSNNIDSPTIALYRYANGQWNKLPTQQIDSDADYLYFKATVSGFSYFAIMAKSVAATTTNATTTTAAVTTTTAAAQVLPQVLDWTLVVVIVIVVAAVLLFFLIKKLKKKKSEGK